VKVPIQRRVGLKFPAISDGRLLVNPVRIGFCFRALVSGLYSWCSVSPLPDKCRLKRDPSQRSVWDSAIHRWNLATSISVPRQTVVYRKRGLSVALQ